MNAPHSKGKDVADSGGDDVADLEDDYDHLLHEGDPLVDVGTDPAHVLPEDLEPPRVIPEDVVQAIPEDVERPIPVDIPVPDHVHPDLSNPTWNMGLTPGGSLLSTQASVESAQQQPQPAHPAQQQPQPAQEPAQNHMNLRPRKRKELDIYKRRPKKK